MKTIHTLIGSLFLAFSLSAAEVPTVLSDCRHEFTSAIPYGSELLRVQKDLLNGIWTEDIDQMDNLNGMKRVLQFNDFGLLDIVNVYSNGHTVYENQDWRLEALGNHVFLILYDHTLQEELIYEIEQDCAGIHLVNIDNYEHKQLIYSPALPTASIKGIRTSIIGNWSHSSYPFDIVDNLEDCGTYEPMNGAYLNYTFNEDGSFSSAMGSDMVDLQEVGFWEITKNGHYLVFHLSRDGSPEEVYTSRYVKLLHADDWALSLEQALTTSGMGSLFCTQMKTFQFYKEP